MRQSGNHDWRRLAQLAQSREALCGACASAPVRQSPLGDGVQLAQQRPLRQQPTARTILGCLSGAQLAQGMTCRLARARVERPAGRGNSYSSLEPISKSPEEDNEASELYEAEEVLGVVFPTDEDAALPLNPSKEALHEPASHIAA